MHRRCNCAINARALGDPSLQLAFWFGPERHYVDGDGTAVKLPDEDSGRSSTFVERDGQPIAVLLHDPVLEQNAELVASVCAAASLSLENERLQAELRARLAELQASRARLVQATDAERRRIERDLHDGTQQRLVSIAIGKCAVNQEHDVWTSLRHEPSASLARLTMYQFFHKRIHLLLHCLRGVCRCTQMSLWSAPARSG